MKKIPLPTLLTAGAVVLILLVYAFTFQVRFSEAAVKVRLGKATEDDIITQPGIYFRWPWPIETIKTYDVRLRTLDTMESEIKTADDKNIVVGNYALWRIARPLDFYERLRTTRQAEEQLRARINQRRAAVIGTERLGSFVNLNEDLVNQNYDRIEEELLLGTQAEEDQAARSLKESVLEDFGIELVRVDIRRISLPEETTQSVFQQMIAERQKEAARFKTEGESRAQTITSEAESVRDQILSFANRKAEEIRSKGVQASTGILEQIAAEDIEFFEWLRWLDALQAALAQRSTIFLDSESPMFKYYRPPVDLNAAPQAQGQP